MCKIPFKDYPVDWEVETLEKFFANPTNTIEVLADLLGIFLSLGGKSRNSKDMFLPQKLEGLAPSLRRQVSCPPFKAFK